MSRVVVVGAGLAGLAAACRLVADGHDVTVVERDSEPGGRNGVLVQDGFTFDTGPTVFTMPHLLDRLFAGLGRDRSVEVPLRRLDPGYRAVYADGSELLVRAKMDDQVAEIRRRGLAADAAAYPGFVTWLEELYGSEMPHFIERNFDSPLDLLTRPAAAARLLRLGGFGSLEKAVGSRFRDPRLVRLFTFQAMYAGLAPADALAIYAVITYMDCVSGVYFPEGGMHAVPTAMARALGESGADLRYAAPVERDPAGRLGSRRRSDRGRREDRGRRGRDHPRPARRLRRPAARPAAAPRCRQGRATRPSAVVWHVGVRGRRPAGRRATTTSTSATPGTESFDAADQPRQLMTDPSRLVTVPSLDAPAMAPEGHSALYVLEPVPNLSGARSTGRGEAAPLRERLHRFLAAQGYPTTSSPSSWSPRRTGRAAGHGRRDAVRLAHTFGQTGPFRPPQRRAAGARVWSSPAAARRRGSASRWC